MLTHANLSPQKPKRVVVLGASRFISRHLQNWCQRNDTEWLAIGSTEVDLSDPCNAPSLAKKLRTDDVVVMTSILTPDKGSDVVSLMANLRMAETVCLALRQSMCLHFVYLSSDAVYDAHQIPLDEDSSREPVDLYALSHTAREMMISTELTKGNIPHCILRLTAVYGYGDTHNAYGPNRFVRSAIAEGHIKLFGRGEERRSHVYINDVINLIGLVLLHRSTGVLNIASRPVVSYHELACRIVGLVSGQVSIEHVQRTVKTPHRPYKLTQIFRFVYNFGRPIGPIVHRTFMNSAVFAAFPKFRFTSINDGLSDLIKTGQGNTDKAFVASSARASKQGHY